MCNLVPHQANRWRETKDIKSRYSESQLSGELSALVMIVGVNCFVCFACIWYRLTQFILERVTNQFVFVVFTYQEYDFPVLIFTDVSGHCWIVFGQARATVMRVTRNGVSPTTNYVTVEKSRQCHTSSTLVHWPSLMAVYCAYMKQMRLPSTGWQHMALSTR